GDGPGSLAAAPRARCAVAPPPARPPPWGPPLPGPRYGAGPGFVIVLLSVPYQNPAGLAAAAVPAETLWATTPLPSPPGELGAATATAAAAESNAAVPGITSSRAGLRRNSPRPGRGRIPRPLYLAVLVS